VRDLRGQGFLRELVVGVAASSDLAGSIIVEIFIVLKAGTLSKYGRTSKQLSRICDCSSFSLTCVLYLACTYCPYLLHA